MYKPIGFHIEQVLINLAKNIFLAPNRFNNSDRTRLLFESIQKVTDGEDHRVLITPRPKPPPEEKKVEKVRMLTCHKANLFQQIKNKKNFIDLCSQDCVCKERSFSKERSEGGSKEGR